MRAAAELRDAGAALSEPIERDHGVRVGVRLGVDSGEVFIAAGARRETFATGDVLNVAAGLKARALEGEVLLGERAHRLVAPDVEAEALGAVAVEGRAATVQAWRLLGLAAYAPLEFRAPAAAFVGRRRELDELRGGARPIGPRAGGTPRLRRRPAGHRQVAPGERGGRRDRRRRDGRHRSLPQLRGGHRLRPARRIVRRLTGDDPERGLARVLAAEEQAGLIARRIMGAIGLSDASAQPEETFWAVRRLFEAVARERPLVAVIDDVHWADPALLDLLDYLVAFSTGAPILLLCLARPEISGAAARVGGATAERGGGGARRAGGR